MNSETIKTLKKEQFLPSITTTRGSDWKKKIKEVKKLGLKRIALFPTCLKKEQRKELYESLGQLQNVQIPFVHLRSDMEPKELDYLVENYKTKVFNIHSHRKQPFLYDYSGYKKMLYIENNVPWDEVEIKRFAGVCLDFSHLENDRRLQKEIFKKHIVIMEKYPLGCNHISAVADQSYMNEDNHLICDLHHLENLAQLDYLKNYPLRYFSPYVAIELENPLKEQLKAIDYIIKILNLKP